MNQTPDSTAITVVVGSLFMCKRRLGDLDARERKTTRSAFLLNVGLTRTRVPTATPEDDRGEKAEPRRYALLTLIRHRVGGYSAKEVERPCAYCQGENRQVRTHCTQART